MNLTDTFVHTLYTLKSQSLPAEVKEEEPEIPFGPNSASGNNPYDHNRRRTIDGTVDANGMQSTTPGGTKFM
jgi:hypothetical protein